VGVSTANEPLGCMPPLQPLLWLKIPSPSCATVQPWARKTRRRKTRNTRRHLDVEQLRGNISKLNCQGYGLDWRFFTLCLFD